MATTIDRTQPGWLRAVRAMGIATKSMGSALRKMVFPSFGGSNGNGGSLGGFGRYGLKFLMPGSSGYDFEAEAGPLWLNSAVAACIGWIRKNFPEPVLTVERRRGPEWVEVPDHEVLEALADPNPHYTDDVLWAATCLSLTVDGNAYWLKVRAPGGKTHYWYLPHWLVFPCWPADGSQYISHYEYRPDGKTIRIEVSQIIHYRSGLDPFDERRGWPELKTCVREVCSDNEANTYVASVLKNMGIVGVVITPENEKDEIDPDEADALKKSWAGKTTGTERGKPIINSVALKITELGMSPEKLTLDKIRQIPESRICAAIGIPAMVVGLAVGNEGRTFSNLNEANRHAYENCLIPLQKSLAKDFQRQSPEYLRNRRKERLVWKYDEVQALREDQSELVKRLVLACGGPIMTRNEGRTRAGLKPLPNPEYDELVAVAAPGDKPSIGGVDTESESKS